MFVGLKLTTLTKVISYYFTLFLPGMSLKYLESNETELKVVSECVEEKKIRHE